MQNNGLPPAPPGRKVGLLGGSFDPPHEGHVHITLEALKRFGLDEVWWLVSPHNPLKAHGPAPLVKRMEAAREIMRHPRVRVLDFEARAGSRYTARTLNILLRVRPRVRFVWLMGADNLAGFHRWENWRWIMENVPIGVIARPGDRISARFSPAARRYRAFRLPAEKARLLSVRRPPAWCFLNIPMLGISSTQLRAAGGWGGRHAASSRLPDGRECA